ncbi:MAG: RAMP superfamily CRISPR-associated protein, partial [Synergistaceae bacterium]|nr:RAMP superfamily CRISPR-associated protein [Synergistaceae bacterium]
MTPAEEQTLVLTFESDWHIGSGAGIPGSVDRQVLRDKNGLPYVPGKTLTGILRDAAEWVASIRDAAEKGDRWRKVRTALFGEQPETYEKGKSAAASAAAIGIGSAVFSPETQKYMIEHKDVLASLFVVRPGVKIDPKTGRSLEKHLFFTEEVRGGCSLSAPLQKTRELSSDEEKLLSDAIKAVRRVGGGRRRGRGKCKLEKRGPMSSGTISTSQENSGQFFDILKKIPGFLKGDSVELDFRLTTLQPVVANKVTLGNVVKSDVTLPGVVLLPWLTREVLKPLGRERVQAAV